MDFRPDHLEVIASTKEVEIATRSGSRIYRTVIWIATDGTDVFVRSVRGVAGRWFQRATTEPEVTVHVGEFTIPARAVAATDAASVERASEAFRRKYPPSRSLDSMLRPDVLGTTLRLEAS